MRLFFAVPVAEEVRDIVSGAVGRIPLDPPPWRWIQKKNYHITLKFLGEVEERLLAPVRDAASAAADSSPSFELSFGRFGAFPSISNPRVLFFDAERGSEELAALAGRLEDALAPVGFERERRRFRAHLTLARVKKRPRPEIGEILGSIPPLPGSAVQVVDRFVLVKSTLTGAGAIYDEIHSFSLSG